MSTKYVDITQYGFKWGAADVKRLFSDEEKGWVCIGVDTPKSEVQIYITKTGKVRVFKGAIKKGLRNGESKELL